jgi:predicted GNAT family N-acyltransferase
MIVREQVFVREQHIPLQYEFDSDDARSCHWVVYASDCRQEDGVTDPDTGAVTLPAQARSKAIPVGTIRLVPFPHSPHPKAGREYVDGKLLPPRAGADAGDEHDAEEPEGLAPYGYKDRETSLHDGTEPYVKLGRLAVVPGHRGKRLAGLLVNAALDWAAKNQTYFDHIGSQAHWNGLVCVHAQVSAVLVWQRHGFVRDELMGEWYEEGIPHVGMFRRLEFHDDEVLPGLGDRG